MYLLFKKHKHSLEAIITKVSKTIPTSQSVFIIPLGNGEWLNYIHYVTLKHEVEVMGSITEFMCIGKILLEGPCLDV